MRVVCYARYSSDLQRETSIEDQLAVAKRYAEDRGWQVLQDHIHTDAAVSGASINGRAAVQRLLSSAEQKPRPFDVLLVDDSSRIARDSFAYCDDAFAAVTNENALEMLTRGSAPTQRQLARVNQLTQLIVHGNEHYGNLVTYMRMKGIVPPSSAPTTQE